MKKILLIIATVISCLLFYNAYDAYNYQNYLCTINSYLQSSDPRSINTLIVNYETSQDRKHILMEIEQTAKDTNSSIAYVTSNVDENGIYNENLFFYIPSKYTLDVYLEDEDTIIDFSQDNNQVYYTSDETDEARLNLLTSFNHRYFDSHPSIINIYPFCQSFNQPTLETALVLYVRTDDIDTFRQTFYINMEGSSIDYSDNLLTDQGHYASSEIDESINEKIVIGLVVALIAYLIAYCIMVNKNKKKISIYRIEGYSPYAIVLRFYCPIMVACVLLYGISTLCCSMLFTSFTRTEYWALYSDVCQYFLLFCLGNVLAIVCTWLYLRYTTQYVSIDLHAGFRQIIRINYIVKVIVALVLMGGFCQCVKESIPTIRYYQTAIKYRSLVNHTQMLDRVPMTMKAQQFGTELFNIGYYFNFEEYQTYSDRENSLMYEYMGDRYLDEYYMSEPYLVCNGNYIDLMGNAIYDIDGNPIDVHTDSNDVLLVPEKYRYLDLTPYSHGSSVPEVIYVQHTGTYVDMNMRDPKSPMYDPIIQLRNQWSSSFNVDQLLLPKNTTYDEEYYYQLMHKYSISENDLAFLNTGYYYDVYLLELEHSLIDFLYVIFLYMFVFGMLLYQSTSAYVMKNKKQLAISYLNGIPRMKRYGDLLLQNISLYLLISVLSILVTKHTVSDTVLFVSFFGSLEFLIQLLMLIKMERRSISDALKGE